MKVCDVMTTRVVTVEMDDRLTVVKEILDKAPFRHLLVVENEQLQGVISDRDLLRSLSPFLGTDAESVHDAHTINQRAHQIMTRSPTTISPELSIDAALTIMLNSNIGCLPVQLEDKMIGIFTWHDGVRALLSKFATIDD